MTLRAGLLTLAFASSVMSSCAVQTAAPASTSGSLTRVTTTEGRSLHSSSSEGIETGNKASPTTEPEALTDLVGFTSPRGNVGCYLDPWRRVATSASATGRHHRVPLIASVDYGQGINLAAGEAPNFFCASDTALGGGNPLAYGQSVSAGTLRCDSAETGITCTDSMTKHGFSISRERYQLF